MSSKSGGFWKKLAGGSIWTNMTDDLVATGVNTFAVYANNSLEVFINLQNVVKKYSHGIYRTSDGGTKYNSTNKIFVQSCAVIFSL